VFPRLIEDIVPLGRGFEAAIARLDVAEPQSEIPVDSKLAGNVLSNFGAFLKKEWRDNDWLWGQLDAVAPLVDVLVTQDTLVAAAGRLLDGPSPADALCSELRRIVVGDDRPTDRARMAISASAFMEWAVWASRKRRIEAAAQAAVSLAVRERSDETAAATTGGTVADIDDKDLAAVRDALIARRQWEIVTAWKEKDGRLRSPAEVVEWTEQYWIGLETLRDIKKPDRDARLADAARAGWGCVNSNLGRVQGESLIDRTAALVWWGTTARGAKFRTLLATFFLVGVGLLIAGASMDAAGGWKAVLASMAGAPGTVALLVGFVAIFLNRGVLATIGVLGGGALIGLSIMVGKAWVAPLLVGGLGCLTFVGVLAGLYIIRRKVR
jgi:hypothetical protein